jgi:HK97 family phage portal protein
MGFIGGALMAFRARSGEESTLANPGSWLSSWFGGGVTKSGIAVNEDNAKNLAAVWACVRAISEDVSKLPLKVYRRNDNEDRETVRNHPAWRLLNVQANDDMTPSIVVREYALACAQLWGNGFAEIERNNAGRPINLWPMKPARTKLRRVPGGGLEYEYHNDDGSISVLPAVNVWHIRGPSNDGIVGASVVAMARESLGAAMATDRFAARFWANGARPSGAIKVKGRLSDNARVNLRESIERLYGGSENAGRPILLEEESDWSPFSVPPEDAQFLETRSFQVDEICRWFRVPPHKIFKLDHATYSNIEHQSIEYVTDGLGAWMTRIEQESHLKLLLRSEQSSLYLEHLVDALLRGDLKTRYEAYGLGRQWGYLSANDVRRRENMNRLPGDDGDQYLEPSNMTTPAKLEEPTPAPAPPGAPAAPVAPGTDPEEPDPAPEPEPEADRAAIAGEIAASFEPLFADVLSRVLQVEADRARRAAKHGVAGVAKWMDEYYGDRVDDVRGAIFAGVEVIGRMCRRELAREDEQLVPDLALALAKRHVDTSVFELRMAAGLEVALSPGGIEACMVNWETTRAARDAAQAVGLIKERILQGQATEGV